MVAGSESESAVETGAASRAPRPSWIRWGIPAIVVVFVLAVGAGFLATRSTAAYDDATEQRFVEACVADAGDQVRPACECIYTAITEQIPYDRFVEVDEDLQAARAAGQEIVLPDDIAALVPACQIPA